MKLALLLLSAALIFGQARVEFEVASVRGVFFNGSHAPNDCRPSGDAKFGSASAGRVQLACFPITTLIYEAYPYPVGRIAESQKTFGIMGTIGATMPVGTTRDQYREMLRNLLVDRYHLKTHVETREAETFTLVQDKGGHRLKEHSATVSDAPVATELTPGADGFPVGPTNKTSSLPHASGRAWRLHAVDMSMQEFAEKLSSVRMYVRDDTGLKGRYDFQLDYAAANVRVTDEPEVAPPIEAAVQKLGLRLMKAKGPVEFLVIDSVDKTPTEN